MFSEHISANKFQNMVKEMMIKVSLYNLLEELHKMDGNNLSKASYATELFCGIVLVFDIQMFIIVFLWLVLLSQQSR
jgi:hypothetical protein